MHSELRGRKKPSNEPRVLAAFHVLHNLRFPSTQKTHKSNDLHGSLCHSKFKGPLTSAVLASSPTRTPQDPHQVLPFGEEPVMFSGQTRQTDQQQPFPEPSLPDIILVLEPGGFQAASPRLTQQPQSYPAASWWWDTQGAPWTARGGNGAKSKGHIRSQTQTGKGTGQSCYSILFPNYLSSRLTKALPVTSVSPDGYELCRHRRLDHKPAGASV